MAFFEGHPEYEAVEAMIRRSVTGPALVRAILTRHDQTQVDHVNDETVWLAAQAGQRLTCLRDISVSESIFQGLQRIRVEFSSHAGDAVTLDVVCASPPDRARGGLSDPGNHAATSSLPMMWRGSSALAGETTRVIISGVDFPVPVKFRAGPHFVAHQGYFTESHHMAVLRAGDVVLDVIASPSRHEVGAEWIYRTIEGERSYRISSLEPDGRVRIERTGNLREQVSGRLVGRRLDLQRVQALAGTHGSRGVTLAFDTIGGFTIDIDANESAVCGDFSIDGRGVLRLRPESPTWARARPISVRAMREGSRILLSTTVGTSPNDGNGKPVPRPLPSTRVNT
jgi:hypothetical protein